MAVQLGTAFVDVKGDLTALNKALVGAFAPAKLRGLALKGGLAIGAGLAVGAAGKGLFDLGQQFDNAFDRVRVATGKTGVELRGLQGDLKSVLKTTPTNIDSTATAIGGLASRLDITGKPLQRLAKQLLQLSNITGTDINENVESVTRLFKDWMVPTGQQTEQLNKLFRVGQKTGSTVSNLSRLMVQFGSPLRQLGFDFETAAAMFGRFEKEGVNITTIMPGFRFALKNLAQPTGEAADQLKKLGISAKDPKLALQEVFKAIKDAPTALKANAIAFAIFGRRAGPDMAAAVREGRFELDKLKGSMETSRDSIGRAETSTRDFGEEWQLLKNRLAIRLEPLGRGVFSSISRMLKIVTDPNLSGAEKWDRISGIIGNAFQKGFEAASKAAVEFGPKIATALFRGFLNAPPLVQLLGGAWLLKRAAPLLASAGLLGRSAGTAFSTGMATTVATQGAAGGAAAGGLAAFGAKLAKVAKVGAGVAVGAAILEGARLRLQKGDVGLQERLKQLQAPGVLGVRSIVGGAERLASKLPFGPKGDKDSFNVQIDKSKELSGILKELNSASGDRVGVLQRQAAEIAKQLDLTQQQKTELASMFRLKATGDVARALGGLTAAAGTAKDALPGVVAAQKRVNELREQGKTGTHAYAVAVRALDAAEATRNAALRSRADLQRKALDATKADLSAAQQTLVNDRRLGASKGQLRKDLIQVAQAASRQQAALANVSRATRGLTPITGEAATKMGALLKTFKDLPGADKFKKFLITTDVSSAENAIKVVSKLQTLGKGRVAMRIFADSKTPEEALKRLQALVKRLEDKEHRITMRLKDEATARLDRLKRTIDRLPERKKLTFDADVNLTRRLADLLRRAGLGPASKQLTLPRARGGVIKPGELSLVGEEGAELAKLPTGKLTMLGQQGPEVRELPVGTRVYSHPETKRKLPELAQKVVQRLVPASIREPQPLVQRVIQALGTDSGKGSQGQAFSGALQELRTGGRVKRNPFDRRFEVPTRRRKKKLPRPKATPLLFKPRKAAPVFRHRIASDEDEERGQRIAQQQERGREQTRLEARQDKRKERRQDKRRDERRSKRTIRAGERSKSLYRREHGRLEHEEVREAEGPEWHERLLDKLTRSPTLEKLRGKNPSLAAALDTAMLGGPTGSVRKVGKQLQGIQRIPKPKKPTWEWTTEEQLRHYGMDFSSGGDAVPGGYNGYYIARNKKGEVMGHLDYQSASGDKKALIAMVEVKPQYRRQGVAKKLLEWARRDSGLRFVPGYTTEEGGKWWKAVQPRKSRRSGGDSTNPGRRLARTSQLAGVSVTPSEVSAITGKWGVNRAVASIGAAVKDKFPGMNIISGFRSGSRTRNNSRSNHAIRAALDLGTGRNVSLNRRIGSWVRSNFPTGLRGVSEGVLDIDHDPNPPDHADHVHVAAQGSEALAKVMESVGADGPGEKDSGGFGRFLATAYGPPWGGIQGTGTTKRGTNLKGAPKRHIVAVDPKVIPLGSWLDIAPNPFGTDKAFLADDIGGAIKGKRIDFYDWRGRSKQRAWGRRKVSVKKAGRPGVDEVAEEPKDTKVGRLEAKLALADLTDRLSDDLAAANALRKHWQAKLKRAKRSKDSEGIKDAAGNVKTYRDQVKTLRKELKGEIEPEPFELGGLTQIGTGPNAFQIGGLHRAFEKNDLDRARAALTLPPEGDETQASITAFLTDDIAAAKNARGLWEGLDTLVTKGFRVPAPPLPPFNPTKAQSAALNKTKTPEQRIALLKKFMPKAKGDTWMTGTAAQKIDAATGLKTAREDLKDLTDQSGKPEDKGPRLRALSAQAALTPGKEDDIAAAQEAVNQYQTDYNAVKGGSDFTAIADAAESLKGAMDELKSLKGEAAAEKNSDLKAFLSSLTGLFKEFRPNFAAFAKGGTSRLPLALVGEQGFELAKPPGRKAAIVGAQGPEIRKLPVGTRVFSHPETKRKLSLSPQAAEPIRLARSVGIAGFAEGGVIQPARATQTDESLTRAIERLEAVIKKQSAQDRTTRKRVSVVNNFEAPPPDPHVWSHDTAHFLESAV